MDLALYLVTSKRNLSQKSFESFLSQCIRGGVTGIQLREKSLPDNGIISIARAIYPLLSHYKIPLIINDYVHLAKLDYFSGVHLGQADACPVDARKQIGSNKIIGLSVNTLKQAHQANNLPIDYIAISPIFATYSKRDTDAPVGITLATEIISQSLHPTCAIGGINLATIPMIQHLDLDGFAITSALEAAVSPQTTARELRNHVNGA